MTEVVWFLCKRDFFSAVGLWPKTGLAGTGVSFAERQNMVDDENTSDDGQDFLEMTVERVLRN